MNGILDKLKGGDLRSIGRSDDVVGDILENPDLFPEVFEGMLSEDPVVRMRSADAVEKASSRHPEYLQPLKRRLIEDVSKIRQKEVRWHVAQMFAYLEVDASEKEEIARILFSYVDESESRIVKVNSLQTLADLAGDNERLKERVLEVIRREMVDSSPSLVSRGRKLIAELTD